MSESTLTKKTWGPKSFIPLLTFLAVYLGAGLISSLMGVENPFKQISREFAVLCGLCTVLLLSRGKKEIDDNVDLVAKHCGEPGVMLMIMIFALAGAFSGAAKAMGGMESAVNFGLSIIPRQFVFAGVFVISSVLALAMGTSMGTIAAIGPIALGIAEEASLSPAIAIAAVIGGGMFGDNLSVISDTTIAACNGQGCKMTDKFKENFFIALPAAIVSLVIIYSQSVKNYSGGVVQEEYHLIQAIPYILVLAGGILGLNVFLVLITGIISGSIIMIATGMIVPTDLLGNMGDGAAGMFETSMVAILVASICALIKEYGGFAALLYWIKKVFKGRKGGLLGMGLLVGLMDIATANNTVAIVMANPIAKEMSGNYGISNKKAASILDTFSCIFQGILPYGAQMLVAISAASGLGETVSAFDILPRLFYPYMLFISSLVFISFEKNA